MKVLIACEESQAVTKAFREIGHEAFSCDLLPCSGGHPEWHFKEDVFKVIKQGWDLMIAHPPCTYLAVSGARWLYNKDGSINEERFYNQKQGLDFVQMLMDAPIDKIAIENPISVISSAIRKPDQIIQPYWFGDSASKSTCLWLKNLPKLEPTNIVSKGEFFTWIDKKTGKEKRQPQWYADIFMQHGLNKDQRRTLRSKTFKGIADAMAMQWGGKL